MALKWLLVLSPILGLAVDVLAQVSLYRLRNRQGLLKSLVAAFGVGAISVAALTSIVCLREHSLASDLAPYFLVNAAAYAALGYGYFHFVNLIVTARRIRILTEILDARGGLTLAEIMERYDAAQMVRNRLGRLIDSGQVRLVDGRYVIGKPVMLYISRAIVFMKVLVLGKRSEFD